MARPLRIEYPGAWYHVMHRGAQMQHVFLDDADHGSFYSLLQDIRDMWNVETHTISLMDLKVKQNSIARARENSIVQSKKYIVI